MSDGVGGPGWARVDDDDPVTARRPWRPRSCTGLTARWCPNHGTCKCTVLNDAGSRRWDDNMDHDDCPLHTRTSTHPFKRKTKIIQRRPS